MNYLIYTAALLLLLSACSSNQTADINQQQFDDNQNIKKTVETIPQEPRAPVIPIDGRLRDEHMQMYVSVKIKQEQLRYQHEEAISPIVSKDNSALKTFLRTTNPFRKPVTWRRRLRISSQLSNFIRKNGY